MSVSLSPIAISFKMTTDGSAYQVYIIIISTLIMAIMIELSYYRPQLQQFISPLISISHGGM